MDGNRRWAGRAGLPHPSLGHRHGAKHLDDLLRWCESAGIVHVTVIVCSTENLARRDSDEVAFLMNVIEELANEVRDDPQPRWSMHVAGQLEALPDTTARSLKSAVNATAACPTGNHVTLAIGYGGRQEVVEAIRDLLIDRAGAGSTLEQVAEHLTASDIARHFVRALRSYTGRQRRYGG